MIDMLEATTELLRNCGCVEFELNYDGARGRYAATARFRGTRCIVDDRHTAWEACLALAVQILDSSMCRCGKQIWLGTDIYAPVPMAEADGEVPLKATAPGDRQCWWRLVRNRWEPGCDVPPVEVHAQRGDLGAAREAYLQAHPDAELPTGGG